ncbi:Cysteine-rich receptor-kinase-like protein [Melia azedarach]|uniref:Cysteine-rich receptor-kinase-like protein n=1 Tax=Melia azedarach TaxID=155640 RepID=A0ACC1WXS7_MELAZ|nr:Cysteine-rich receptor-kinase-like protein [Melia azedarach]
MASLRLLFFFCSIVLCLVTLSVAQQQTVLDTICVMEKGNFTRNSIYQKNLRGALSSLTSNKRINSGFYRVSFGRNRDQVNAVSLCRGDVKPNVCRSCISRATFELQKRCPIQKEAVIWYDNCMLRYAYRYIFGNMEFEPYFWMNNMQTVSNANAFTRVLSILLNGLKNKAASGSLRLKYATGSLTVSNAQTIYALVQCTPDLSKQQCINCINQATSLLPKCCITKQGRGLVAEQGGRVIAPSCNFRYETNRFYA